MSTTATPSYPVVRATNLVPLPTLFNWGSARVLRADEVTS